MGWSNNLGERELWALVAGVVAGATAAAFAVVIATPLLPAGAAAFLTALPVWWAVVSAERVGIYAGAVAGGRVGLLSNLVYWVLLFGASFHTQNSLAGDFLGIVVLAAVGVALFGAVTVPLGAVSGAALGYVQANYAGAGQKESEPG